MFSREVIPEFVLINRLAGGAGGGLSAGNGACGVIVWESESDGRVLAVSVFYN
jgi:hypothetical protein